ncbi:MAG: SUMF1/EgtB/PvdO family nonheme iron enzyme [Treponema sp.]|jgi:formylglycine-generating enzyme required for sulfatase activity|nr:SUMF1/EgtB/PvdO family nonheme iron enzyme [Treponema sp.]
MKNLLKHAGFTAIFAIIGFFLAACDDSQTTTFTVTFNANGSTDGTAPSAINTNQNTGITLPGQGNLARTGYSFGGWNTSVNGSGTTYAAGYTYIITANLALYAKWNINNYTVTFDINGAGGTAPTAQTADYSTGITLPNDSSFSKPGVFGGWSEYADGSGTTYAAGSYYTVTGNVTLYAKWTHTVTFDANGATGGTAPAAMSANQGASITLPDQGNLVKAGYILSGWNINASGGGTTYSAGSSYTVTGNVTLYAKWDAVMVWINPGTFTRNGYTITLTSGFYMGKYEVTQEQYHAVMENNPSYFHSSPASGEVQGKRPVEWVRWYDAIVFCNKLSMAEGLIPAYSINGSTDPADWATWDAVQVVAGSTGYRLPTEAQWEYACRAGTTTTWSFGDNQSSLTNYAWYIANSNGMTHEVGKKLPNAWGLYDMHGNVWEWCWDWFGNYPNTAQTDPAGAVSGSHRLYCGGGWSSSAEDTASVSRDNYGPGVRYNSLGFRLLRP